MSPRLSAALPHIHGARHITAKAGSARFEERPTWWLDIEFRSSADDLYPITLTLFMPEDAARAFAAALNDTQHGLDRQTMEPAQ